MQTLEETKRTFIKTINEVSRRWHVYEVFSDFAKMSAISIANAVEFCQEREDTYLKTAKKYRKDELQSISHLLGLTVLGLEHGIYDFLGDVFMSLELGSDRAGQFFTPYHVSKMMAMISLGDLSQSLQERPFITVSEPACGAGSMLLACADVIRDAGLNPQEKMWMQAVDIDATAAAMCYVQLSLCHIPAQVITGNTLTGEIWGKMHTPAHVLGGWDFKLRKYLVPEKVDDEIVKNAASDAHDIVTPTVPKAATAKSTQLLFDFA